MIRKGEKLALALNPEDGYFVGFSGGKDSQVLLDLVKRAGVKYKAHYNVTTIDPPENVRFIRQYYPEVHFIHPRQTFIKMIEKRGLPTIFHRFCCEELKEKTGAGNVVLTGVRADESTKRSQYNEVAIKSNRVEHADRLKKHTIEEIEQNEHRCIKGKDAIMVYPILNWTETEVWQYIADNNLPHNPCYNIAGRVGCMFCPFANKRQIEFYEQKYPKYKDAIMKHLRIYLANNPRTTNMGADEYYDWWKSKKSLKKWIGEKQQMKLF
ncbi:MAG: phosphoadenosine phosphosulfate reductase family protein [Bacteroidales bacterium]|nr:phosphoadenosine phosphosulfate reductase family protein [Bacteroidales bacterium]